jgi:D-arabinose 1-dehydrogenase-like Zn-dependent alcohol dehydrogenase
MTMMRAVQIAAAGGEFELVQRSLPEPGARQVRVKIEACGVCHSDSLTKEGHWPGITFPRVPGHEVAGVIDSVGADVSAEFWQRGKRVGVGWYGGHCGNCKSCRRGDFVTCRSGSITGITYDGGYADYMSAPVEALVAIPADLNAVDAAPLLCAGITTFNSLRNSGARAGDLVVILGIGGLGHLAVQYAARMGFRCVAVARGKEKEELARQLGAQIYIDSESSDVAAELQKLGGADVILATVTNGGAMARALGGLGVGGKFVILGAAAEPLPVNALDMIGARQSIQGWPSGVAADAEDALDFSLLANVRSMNEQYPLEKAAEAYERMMSGKAKFRVVLTTGK